MFLLTGDQPDDSLLRGAGMNVHPVARRPEHDPETLESNVSGLFVAGSIVSGRDTRKTFIENGRLHGEKIVARLPATR